MTVLGLAAAGLLAACGDNGADANNDVYVPPLVSYAGTTDAFVAWADPISGDFAAPASASYAGKRQSLRGTVDPITGASLGQPAGVEIYKASDGHIYALDLTTTATPTPQQVSSEAAATVDDTCSFTGTGAPGANSDYAGVYFAGDLANPTNDSYFYRLPGADGVCNTADDIIHWVKTSTPASSAPVTVPAMPITAVRSAAGAITGYVVKSGSSLLLYDQNFVNATSLGTFPAPIGVALALPTGLVTGYPTGQYFLVDGNIVFVNYATAAISGTLFTVANWTATDNHALFAASPDTLFMAVNIPAAGATPASASLYALPADGSTSPALLATLAGSVLALQFPVDSSNLIFATLDTTYSILAIDQGGGTPTTLVASTQNSGNFTATAANVYYTTWNTVTDSAASTQTRSGTQSGIVAVNGAVVQAPLAGSLFATGGEAVPWPLDGTPTVQTPLETLIQVRGLAPVTFLASTGWTYTVDGIGGGTMLAIDAASNQVTGTLGVLPASTANALAGTFRSSEDAGFLSATNPASTQGQATRDEYLLDTQVTNSLERVTSNL